MRGFLTVLLLMMVTFSALAASKDSGTTTLQEVQPAGITDKKHKRQQYDLSFVSSTGKDYTCRTSGKKSVKATDIVVGSTVSYQVTGNKGKVKTSGGKDLSCTIVRVANVAASPQ